MRHAFFTMTCVSLLAAACGGGDRTSILDAGTGVSCGATTCAIGQVCCVDCDGTASCIAPGTACGGPSCMADAGTPDGGVLPGIECGAMTCSGGQICCIDCDGTGMCGPPGTACAGPACAGDDAGTVQTCGGRLCGPNEECLLCCGTNSPGMCAPIDSSCAGVECPSPCPPGQCITADDGPCEEPSGPTGNGCCECGPDGFCIEFCRCASPDTLVDTPSGPRAIAELRIGDPIYSMHGGAIVVVPVARTRSTPVRDHAIVRTWLANGAVLEISPIHPTADGRRFADLAPGSRLGDVEVVAVELAPYDGDATYDVLPDSDSGTYFAGGALVGSTLR